jgi:hypothetical protein
MPGPAKAAEAVTTSAAAITIDFMRMLPDLRDCLKASSDPGARPQKIGVRNAGANQPALQIAACIQPMLKTKG